MAEKKEQKEFVNPFNKGVTYEAFLKAKGNTKIADYCKDKLTQDQISWIEKEIKLINK